MPAFNAEELLQISEYLLIFIKASKEWILTVIFTLASASLFLSQQTYPEFTYPSGLLHTAPTFLKTCSQVYSVLHLAVEHWTDCVLNLRKLLCIGDVFYATLETGRFLDDFCWLSQVAGVDLWCTHMMVRLHKTGMCVLVPFTISTSVFHLWFLE